MPIFHSSIVSHEFFSKATISYKLMPETPKQTELFNLSVNIPLHSTYEYLILFCIIDQAGLSDRVWSVFQYFLWMYEIGDQAFLIYFLAMYLKLHILKSNSLLWNVPK